MREKPAAKPCELVQQVDFFREEQQAWEMSERVIKRDARIFATFFNELTEEYHVPDTVAHSLAILYARKLMRLGVNG